MAWLQKIRPLLFILGGLVVIGSLLGARLLTHGSGGGDTAAKGSLPTNGKQGSGPIFIGYADSNPSPIGFGLPPVLQSGEIVKLFVQAGQEVKVREYRLFGGTISIGDPLYKFNTQMLEAKLIDAQSAVNVAKAKLVEAQGGADLHSTKVNLQEKVVDAAEQKVKLSLDAWRLGESNFTEAYKAAGFPEDTFKKRLGNEVKIFELYSAHIQAQEERNVKKAELAGLKSAKEKQVLPLVASAEAEVQRYEALVDEARTAVDLCTVRTKMAGTVERINFWPGDVIGISTRQPAVILVPNGPRIVRAEIEAEFAHRVGRDKIGKEVTIYDNTDSKITYKGKVERIGDTFLPKRSTGDVMVANETRVLEAVIVVENASPAGQPPLRVGQKVRVNFGQ
jgi:multidrug resistance efflux pump